MYQQNGYAGQVVNQPVPNVNPNFNPMYGSSPNPYQWPRVGYGPGPKPFGKVTQPVTKEQSQYILQQEDQLDMRITKPDSIRNSCTHKDPVTGEIALIQNEDGTCTCKVCNARFHMYYNMDEAVLKEKIDDVIDILQSAKTLYVNAPEDFVREFYQVISLLEKLPKVFAKSATDFVRYENYNGGNNVFPMYGQGWMNQGDPFSAVSGIEHANPGMYNTGYYQPGYPGFYPQPGYYQPAPAPQPGYGYQATPPQPAPAPQPGQQPVVDPNGTYKPQWMTGYVDPVTGSNIAPPQAQAPAGYPNYNYATPVNPVENPLGYGAPAAPAPVAPPAAPAATEDVTQTKVMKV